MKKSPRKIACARPLCRIRSSISRFSRNVVTLLSYGVEGADMKTMRRTFSARQASRRFAYPVSSTSEKVPPPRGTTAFAVATTVETPWQAATRLSSSRRSPNASSTPSAENSRGEAGRTRARTGCPAPRSRSTTAVPRWPVAPTTRIGPKLLLDLDGETRRQLQPQVDDAAGPLLPPDPVGHALPDPRGDVLRGRRRRREVGNV